MPRRRAMNPGVADICRHMGTWLGATSSKLVANAKKKRQATPNIARLASRPNRNSPDLRFVRHLFDAMAQMTCLWCRNSRRYARSLSDLRLRIAALALGGCNRFRRNVHARRVRLWRVYVWRLCSLHPHRLDTVK
jgi:hypothetical protein